MLQHLKPVSHELPGPETGANGGNGSRPPYVVSDLITLPRSEMETYTTSPRSEMAKSVPPYHPAHHSPTLVPATQSLAELYTPEPKNPVGLGLYGDTMAYDKTSAGSPPPMCVNVHHSTPYISWTQ